MKLNHHHQLLLLAINWNSCAVFTTGIIHSPQTESEICAYMMYSYLCEIGRFCGYVCTEKYHESHKMNKKRAIMLMVTVHIPTKQIQAEV